MTGGPDPFHLPRRTVTAAGVPLALAELGAPGAPPVLVLHGFTGCAESMLDVAVPLASSHRVLLPDLVGHGRSPVAPPSACTVDAIVAQLADLLDVVGADAADVVGYSMGGRLALSLAVASPGRIRRLVTIGASPGIADPAERETRRAADEALAARLRADGLVAFVDAWEVQPLFASQRHLPPERRARLRAERLASDAEGLARSLEGMGTGAMRPVHGALGGLRRPALLLAGAEDTRFVDVARSMAAALPDARVVLVPGVGHAAHLEAPADVAAAILAFLG